MRLCVCVCLLCFQPVFGAYGGPTTVHDTVCLSMACLCVCDEVLIGKNTCISTAAWSLATADLWLRRHHASQTSAQVEVLF